MEKAHVEKKLRRQHIIIVILSLAILMIVFSAFQMKKEDGNIIKATAEGYSGVEEDSGIYITFTTPVGWYNKETNINIEVEDTKNKKIKKVQAKIGEKGTWQDITDDMYIAISENVTIYVRVTDRTGGETEKSKYIGVFDREKPTLSASVSGNLLRVEANDTLSGIDVIFINGYAFRDLVNDSLDVALYSFSEDENLRIQARDKAGNVSPVYTTKNPLFAELKKAQTEAEKEEAKKEAEKKAAATTTVQPSGNATTTTTPGEGTGEGKNSTGSAENKENPLFGTFEDTNKQFMSIVTKDGKVFYMIIDHDREEENVYLLTEVTNSDLESFTEEEESSAEEEIPTDKLINGGKPAEELNLIVDPDSSDTSENEETSVPDTDNETSKVISAETSENEEKEKKNPLPGYLVLGIIVAIVAFIAYMFLVFLPRKRETEYFEDDVDDVEVEKTDNYDVEKIINNKKVSDHHAIIPTEQLTEDILNTLEEKEKNIALLIATRLIVAVAPPELAKTSKIHVLCEDTIFTLNHKEVLVNGYKKLEKKRKILLNKKNIEEEEEEKENLELPGYKENDIFENFDTKVNKIKATPPKTFTEDTLLSAMEHAGNEYIDDDTEKKGIGTPATMGNIIEELIAKNNFLERNGRQITPTENGYNLIKLLPSTLSSPKMTADWETFLQRIEKGEADKDTFIKDIKDFINRHITQFDELTDEQKKLIPKREINANYLGECPKCKEKQVVIGKKTYFCEDRENCKFVLFKEPIFFTKAKKSFTQKMAKDLVTKGRIDVKGLTSAKTNKKYNATIVLDIDEEKGYGNFKLEF